MEPPSRSTTYRKKKQEITSKKQALPPYSLYAKEMLLKCYIDQEVLTANQAYAVKAHFEDAQGQEKTVIYASPTMHQLQNSRECMHIYRLTGFEDFFAKKPCQVDAQRAHELLSTLQEDGTCTLTDKDGEKVQVNITSDLIVRAFKLNEGGYDTSSLKLTLKDRAATFTSDKYDSVYTELRIPEVKLALQIHQQYFHVLKPNRYTQPDIHMAFVFSAAYKKNKTIRGNWGDKILKDLKRAALTKSYSNKHYMGNGTVLTLVAYEALGMRDQLKELEDDEVVENARVATVMLVLP